MPVITTPVNHAFSVAGNSQRQSTVQDEIFEALEQGKSKCNLILYNMSVIEVSNDVRVRTLCEHIMGEPSPLFHCIRIGKLVFGKSRHFWLNFIQKTNAATFFVRRTSYVTCRQSGLI